MDLLHNQFLESRLKGLTYMIHLTCSIARLSTNIAIFKRGTTAHCFVIVPPLKLTLITFTQGLFMCNI